MSFACGILAILILLFFYPLNETRMLQISTDLKARRAAEPAGA